MKFFNAIAAAAVIGGSLVIANTAEANVINVPCVDGGGSAGWSHQSGMLPDRYYPMVLLGVSEMKPGQYSEHPSYYEDDGGRTRYGYCAYSTSAD